MIATRLTVPLQFFAIKRTLVIEKTAREQSVEPVPTLQQLERHEHHHARLQQPKKSATRNEREVAGSNKTDCSAAVSNDQCE